MVQIKVWYFLLSKYECNSLMHMVETLNIIYMLSFYSPTLLI